MEEVMTTASLGRYWRGEGPLWRVYWIYGVLGSLLLTVAIALPMWQKWIGQGTAIAALIAGAVYTVWILVCVWRCALNIEGEPLGMSRDGWALLARMLTFAWAINVLGLAAILFSTTMRN
jgi:hypothetical protein